MICFLGVSQANSFVENANLLYKASASQRARFYRNAFKAYDANKDGFVTSDEFANVDFETLPRSFASLVSLAMTEALSQFDNEHKNGNDHNKVRITFEDYEDALKRKLEQIYDKKSEFFSFLLNHRLHQLAYICVISPPYFS